MAEAATGYHRLLRVIKARLVHGGRPFLIGIAGPPASGKTMLARQIVDDLNSNCRDAGFCPMDGFHLTNAQLESAGLGDAKGSMETFDGEAFARAVKRLTDREAFWWPNYSRQTHDPVPKGTRITGTESVYVIEGNYIFAEDEPWLSAARAFHFRVFVNAPDRVLRRRQASRHRLGGRTAREAAEKIARTDFPNVETVRGQSGGVDFLLDPCRGIPAG